MSNQNWKQIGAGLRDTDVFCNTFNPNIANILSSEDIQNNGTVKFNQIQIMT